MFWTQRLQAASGEAARRVAARMNALARPKARGCRSARLVANTLEWLEPRVLLSGTIHPNADSTPPTAIIVGNNVTTDMAPSTTVTVDYTDNVAVSVASINTSNITVTGPKGPLNVTGIMTNPTTDSAMVSVTYTVAAPSGGFVAMDDGMYTVLISPVAANDATDTSGNPSSSAMGSFVVDVQGISPTTTIMAPDITAVGGSSEAVTVVYSDPSVAIDQTTINATDLAVVPPGGTQVSISLAKISGSGSTVTATYAIAAPPGGWSMADSGTYTLTVGAGSVSNVDGDPNSVGTQTFNVTIASDNADLQVKNTPSAANTYFAGTSVGYSIVVTNAGPADVDGVKVVDAFPNKLTGIKYSSSSSGTVSGNTANGSGNINDMVSLTSGSSITYAVTSAIPSSTAAGSLSDTANLTLPGAVVDSDTTNDTATASTSIKDVADLVVTNTDLTTSVTAGAMVTYKVVVSNAGPSDVSGGQIVDNAASSLTSVTYTATQSGGANGFTANGSGAISDTVHMPTGSAITYTVIGSLSSAATGTLTATASVNAPSGVTDPDTTNNIAADTDTIANKNADLRVKNTPSASNTYIAGTNVTYSIVVTNAGPSAVTGATVADTFPAALTSVSYSTKKTAGASDNKGAGTGNTLSESVTLASGSSITYTVTGTIPASAVAGALTDNTMVTAPAGITDPNLTNNSSTVSASIKDVADLKVTNTPSASNTYVAGTNVAYTIVVTNSGPSAVTGATVADTFPAAFTNVSYSTKKTAGASDNHGTGTGNTLSDSVTLASGSSITYTVTGAIAASAAAGALTDNAMITAPGGMTDPNLTNNSATVSASIKDVADLKVTNTPSASNTYVAGTNVTYTIVVTNSGPSAVTGATVADTFPAALGNVSYSTTKSAGASDNHGTGTGNTLGDSVTLASGSSITYTVTGAIAASAAAGSLTENATVTAPGGITDPNLTNNSATASASITVLADLAVTNSDGKTQLLPGATDTYTVVVTNAGPSAVTGASITDVLSAKLTGVKFTATESGGASGATISGNGNIADTVTLPVGSAITYTISGKVSAAATGTMIATATVTEPAGATDPIPSNDIAIDTDTILDTTPPTAVITAPNVTTVGAASETVTVVYSDNVAVAVASITAGNITVIGPGGALTVTGVKTSPNANAATITATYTVAAPAGGFVALDNGAYVVSLTSLAANQATDTSNHPASGAPATFTVNVHGIAPTAIITAPNVTTAGGASETITVVFSDPSVAIDTTTIGAGNLTVTAPGGQPLGVSLKKISGSGKSVTATYTVAAPGGAWAIANNGAYAVAIAAGAIKNVDGDSNTAAATTFSVAIPDTTAPTAAITAPNITIAGTATETVTIVYADNVAVAVKSIGLGNISVIGPGSTSLKVTGVTTVPVIDAASITAVYTVMAPGGAFEATDNGTYTVSLLAGKVTDTSGNPAQAAPVTFTVNVHGIAPSALVSSAPTITSAGGASETVTVVYSGPASPINTSTLASANVTVTGPGGTHPGVVFSTFVVNGNSVTAKYVVSAPGGSWQVSANGNYAIAVNANTVLDQDGDGNAAATGAFSVAIPIPDTTAPTAVVSAPDVTSVGAATETVTVVYTDNVAVAVKSIVAKNVSIVGPGGQTLTVTGVKVNPNANAAAITAAYTVAAPGGGFEALDNGTYTVSLPAGAVTDTSGNPVSAKSTTFAVNVHGLAPTAVITAPAIASAGGASETITVFYDPVSPINTATLASSNLTVTGPGATNLTVAFTGFTSSGTSATATYTAAAPGGSWQLSDNGNYAVTVNANAVLDDNGDGNAATSTTFAVAIPAPVVPAGSITTVSPSTPTVAVGDSVTFTATVAPATTGGPLPTGTVSFIVNGTTLSAVPLQSDGTALFSTSFPQSGMEAIVASYSGDSNFAASSSMPLTETVISVGGQVSAVGGLDPSFGVNGLASHNVGLATTSDLIVQPNGQSIIIGAGGSGSTQQFGVARYNADGSLDTSFGGGSAAVFTSFNGVAQAAAGAILSNGDILVAGTLTTLANGQPAGSQVALVEFLPDGSIDPSFGGGAGFVLTSFATTTGTLSNDLVRSMAISSTGEIFVAGSSDAAGHGPEFAIAAYNPDGTPATRFGGTGKVLLNLQGADDSIASIALQRNGDIVAAGTSLDPDTGTTSVAIARFLPTGVLDIHFGKKGEVIAAGRGVDDGAASVVIDPHGKILIGGYSGSGSAAAGTLSADFLLLRYGGGGKLDRSFGNGGVVITSFNQPSAVRNVIVAADGSIIAAGKTAPSLVGLVPSELELAIARYTPSGRLDTTFNATGEAIISLSSTPTTSALQSLGGPRQQPALIRDLTAVAFDSASDLMQAFNVLTQNAEGILATTSGGELLDVGNSDANTVEAEVIGAGLNITAGLIGSFAHTVVEGAKGTVSVQVTGVGNQKTATPITIELFTASSQQLQSGENPFKSFPEKLKLKSGKTKTYRLKFQYPTSLTDADYYLLASISSGSVKILDPGSATSASSSAIRIAPPFVSLSGSGLTTPAFSGVKPSTVSFQVVNIGDVSATQLSAVQFLASTDGSLAHAISISTLPVRFNLKPGAPRLFKEKVALPASLPAGAYTLLALLDPANVFHQTNTANNLLTGDTTFVVG